ncbi:MAG: hypothetical protein WC347_09245 [Smithellaceae bacterium]|jgi:hypothetical protein
MEKMKGVLARLIERDATGTPIGSHVDFRPYCDYRGPQGFDYGGSRFTDMGRVAEEFGMDVVEKLADGQTVEVERDVPEGWYKSSCPAVVKIEVREHQTVYPMAGSVEDLVRIPATE